MTKVKKTVLCAFLSIATVSLTVGAIHVSQNISKNLFKANGVLHDEHCVWNHYDAVMPTTLEHGSQEFWACCTHAENYVFEEPTVADPSQITEMGPLDGAYFASLEDSDARYVPQLEATNALDSIPAATVSDMGVTSGGYVKTGGEGHTFLDYNFLENGGADIWMKYRYSFADGNYDEAALQLYVLNNHSEDGLRIRLDGRAEDDGIAVLYVYSSGQYNNPGTDSDIPSAPTGSAQFFFPRPSGFKSNTDITLHFAITLIDPVNYVFNVKIEAGSGDTLYQISKGPEAGTYEPRSFNIEMGSGYADWINKSLRFTAKRSSDITLTDLESQESVVVFNDENGSVLGKMSNPGTAKMPNIKLTNKTFLGWFDTKGNKLANGATVSTKYIVTPRYVANQTNMFVPSDTVANKFAAAKGGWFESSTFAGECGDQLPVSSVSGRYDFYYIYQFVSKTNDDNYAIFGLPFDFSDTQTRLHVRIDNPTNGNLAGYIYGANTNLGNAGAAGTSFSQGGFRANGSDLLVHIAVSSTSSAGLTLDVEIVNLGNGQVYQTSRNVTFNNGTLYGINNPDRNIFDCMKGNCEYRIRDAF